MCKECRWVVVLCVPFESLISIAHKISICCAAPKGRRSGCNCSRTTVCKRTGLEVRTRNRGIYTPTKVPTIESLSCSCSTQVYKLSDPKPHRAPTNSRNNSGRRAPPPPPTPVKPRTPPSPTQTTPPRPHRAAGCSWTWRCPSAACRAPCTGVAAAVFRSRSIDCRSAAPIHRHSHHKANPCPHPTPPTPPVDPHHPVLRGEHLLEVLQAHVQLADGGAPHAVEAALTKLALGGLRKAVGVWGGGVGLGGGGWFGCRIRVGSGRLAPRQTKRWESSQLASAPPPPAPPAPPPGTHS